MDKTGVNEVTLASGETRYQVVIKHMGRYAYLGWWTTYDKAMKHYKEAIK